MSHKDAPALPSEEPPNRDVVDPLIRAHIYSLCTALGGNSVDETGKYTLGDDALACLKDLRRWLKLYDEKLNRYDVARCMGEMNIVQSDLLEIIAMWKDSDTLVKPKHRLAVACIELLGPLTWPFEKNNEQMTMNHHRHIPVLQHAQAGYKAAILQHKSGKILKDIIRAALPAMAIPTLERGMRDEGVINLVLFVLRNIAIIEHPAPNEIDTGEEINRSATITTFAEQNVFDLLLTVSSGVGDDFRAQDTVVMEVIYHLIKGLNVESVFRSEEQEHQKLGKDLTTLLKMEDDMKRANSRKASTRHNRFGTTVWMERSDGTRSFVSGQGALLGKGGGLEKLDKVKRWKKPRGADAKGISLKTDFDMTVSLDAKAKKHIRKFIEDFIDSGFNPLFQSIRKAIDRDVQRLLNSHTQQYFYLVAWFLEAERVRRIITAKERKAKGLSATDEDNFGVVAAVLNQEFLVTLNRKMVEWFDLKQWTQLEAGMRCFTQILYTVQDMSLSPIEDDQEISENIQNRLFYEEATMELIYSICRSYTRQPFKWLDDCTEMVHVHLKLLEKYSQQHEHMFVRSRRRQTKKRKEKVLEDADDAEAEAEAELEEDEDELVAASKRAVAERAFDFSRFEAKYLNQHCINTFVSFLRHYKELDCNQIMRAIKMFHRIFEKRKMEVLLYRLDLVDLLYQMMQGSEALPRSHPAYKQVDQFAKYFLRKLFKKLEAEPAMYVELLFTKIGSTLHYLQHGYQKEVHVRTPRAAVELQIKPGVRMRHDEQVSVGVGALLDDNKSGDIEWLKDVFKRAVTERKLWEDEAEARYVLGAEGRGPDVPAPETSPIAQPPDIYVDPITEERKTAMFKDRYLRFLLKLVGCEPDSPNETPNTKWLIPSQHSSDTLGKNLTLLQKYANDPPVFEGMPAADLLRPITSHRPKATRTSLSSDSSSSSSEGEGEGPHFEPGGPTAMKPLYKKKKKDGHKRKNRLAVEADAELEEQLRQERKKQRKEAEARKRGRIKSEIYVHDSDDESNEERDREFFEKERELMKLWLQPDAEQQLSKNGKGRRVEMDTDEEGENSMPSPKRRRKMKNIPPKKKSVFGGGKGGSERNSGSESSEAPTASIRRKTKAVVLDDNDDEDVVMADEPIAKPARRRAVIVSSDDE